MIGIYRTPSMQNYYKVSFKSNAGCTAKPDIEDQVNRFFLTNPTISAQINSDITLAELEMAVEKLIKRDWIDPDRKIDLNAQTKEDRRYAQVITAEIGYVVMQQRRTAAS